MRATSVALVALAAVISASACRRPQGTVAADSDSHPARSSDGWSVHDDAEFRLSVPPSFKVLGNTASEGFALVHSSVRDPKGEATFGPYSQRADILIRDAAELELKDYVSGGGKVLAGVRVIPTRGGSCAVFTAVSGQDCREATGTLCGLHHTLGYCDSPKGKRYIFIGDLGATGSVDQRPPGFAKNAANFERVLRSIEFKPAKT